MLGDGHRMNRSHVVVMVCLVVLLQSVAESQKPRQGGQQEQTSFGTEEIPTVPQVKRPAPMPDSVLQVLNTDEGVKSCLENNTLTPGQLLSSWFIASEIHLDGRNETDLVVLPNPYGEQSMCFHSVEGIGWFWVFRQNQGRHELVLKASGNGLEILNSSHNGYKDIQTVSGVGRFVTTIIFHFDGRRYRERQKKTGEAS